MNHLRLLPVKIRFSDTTALYVGGGHTDDMVQFYIISSFHEKPHNH